MKAEMVFAVPLIRARAERFLSQRWMRRIPPGIRGLKNGLQSLLQYRISGQNQSLDCLPVLLAKNLFLDIGKMLRPRNGFQSKDLREVLRQLGPVAIIQKLPKGQRV
jgi:hypothetical protein